MKTIGLLGGMSWESTILYYDIINTKIKNVLGGLHSGKIILYSVEFDEIERLQSSGQWEKAADILGEAAAKLELCGADFIAICTNTMHKIVPQIQAHISIPIIHIADVTAHELEKNSVKRVALIGTKYTMTEDFYKSKLVNRGIEVIVPDDEAIEIINNIIFNELCVGIITEESRNTFSRIISKMKNRGAEAVILGCTEIGLLIHKDNSELPVYDTTMIHAMKAAEIALT